jgi:hypothetical protein
MVVKTGGWLSEKKSFDFEAFKNWIANQKHYL